MENSEKVKVESVNDVKVGSDSDSDSDKAEKRKMYYALGRNEVMKKIYEDNKENMSLMALIRYYVNKYEKEGYEEDEIVELLEKRLDNRNKKRANKLEKNRITGELKELRSSMRIMLCELKEEVICKKAKVDNYNSDIKILKERIIKITREYTEKISEKKEDFKKLL
jgi:hypothetical protein